jgi:hypothetical protein
MTSAQAADVIERFISRSERYPQEFNDFFESALLAPELDVYRQRCEVLHSEFEPHGGEEGLQKTLREAAAIKELEQIIAELRSLQQQAKTPGGG